MAMNTEYLATPSASTTVFSDISSSGTLYAQGLIVAGVYQTASDISGAAITGTTGDFSSTMSIDGNTRMAALYASTGDFSSTLSVDGNLRAAWISCAGANMSSTLTLDDTAAPISVLTNAADTDMTIGQLRLVFLSSGLSLCYSSGDTLYVVNSAQSEAQPTS